MKWSGWRAGTTGAALGLASWLAAPWVSMAVHGTVDARHASRLRGGAGSGARRPDPEAGMPRAWDTIPGPRPLVRDRSGAASPASPASPASSASS